VRHFFISRATVIFLTGTLISGDSRYHHHHHRNEHNTGLGLKTCSFKAQGVLGLSIFVSVFPYPAVPKVGTGKPASVGGFLELVK
jgi:hypothetical protein